MSITTVPPDDRAINGTGLTSGNGLLNGVGLTSTDPPVKWRMTDEGGLERRERRGVLHILRQALTS